MEHLIEFIVFFAKVLTVVVGFMAVAGFIAAQSMKMPSPIPSLEIIKLNDILSKYSQSLRETIFNKKELKTFDKKEKERKKHSKDEIKNRIFVVDFLGDIKASAVKNLRIEMSALLSIATPNDEILVRVTSPGGMVHTYGLASAQLLRVRNAGIPLCVSVDTVAASGGYMMACTANKIIAAPFAILGSIGVLAQVPNFHRFLKKHDVDYQEITAGDYKRTISVLGEITEKGKEKFKEQLQDTHDLFKSFVKNHRPVVNIDQVATGEPWFGERALENNLIDEIKTSDEYLFERRDTHDIYQVKVTEKKRLGDKIANTLSLAVSKIYNNLQSYWT